MLFTGLLIAILFEQYTVALVLLGITLILATFIAVKMRVEKKEILPVHKIKILGYPLKEISSTEVQWEEKPRERPRESTENYEGERKKSLKRNSTYDTCHRCPSPRLTLS